MHSLRYHAVHGVVKALSLLPFGVLFALSDVLYVLLYHVVRYRRRLVRRNLTESFPDKSAHQIVAIERKFYRYFADMILESCKLLSISPDKMRRRMRFVNIDLLNAMLAQGQTVSAFLGHYGNWEWTSSSGLWVDERATVVQVYHQLRNAAIDRVVRQMRERMGNICLDMHKTARFAFEAVSGDKPYVLGLIADQSPRYREVKDYLRFLNHDVPVLTATERLTKRYGFGAIYVSLRRVGRGRYDCVLSRLADDPASLPDYELTRRYYALLEQDIQRQPECYLWSHNRFKYAKQPASAARP